MMLPKLNLRLAPNSATTLTTRSTTTTTMKKRTRLMMATTTATTETMSATPSRTRRLCCCTTTYPLVLLSLLLLVLHPVISNAERDFNFNDSQVPLLEPRDEPTLIEGHHIATATITTTAAASTQHQDPYAVELSHCRYGDNELVLSLVLKNYNWHDLSESRKSKVVDKLSKFFAIPKEFITTESVTKHELYEMQKESLKRGNNKCHTNNNRKLGRVDFIIGCRSSYFTITEPIAKQIGQQVKDGALDSITGEKFGWWVIWRKHYKTRAMRNRRQVEGSGDNDNDDYDNGDYDYDDDEDTIDQQAPSKEVSTTTTHNTYGQPAAGNDDDDDQSELTSNTLEVASNKHHETIAHSRDDITALKHTDREPTLEDNKADSTVLPLNKKGSIDQEIVESVSKLESVITKTIENTKNIEDITDIGVDQPEDVLLKQVLQQPTQPLEEVEMPQKSENSNLNAIYENHNENSDFNVAEVLDALSPHTTTTASGVKLEENGEATTSVAPSTYHHNPTNKDNHLENSLTSSSSPSSSNHDHHHRPHHGENSEQQQHHHHHMSSSPTDLTSTTTITTTLLTPPPPIILIDDTTLTITPSNDISSITSSTMTSSIATTRTTTTSNTNTIATSSDKLNKSNKMIKVDINKYDEHDDDDDDDEDDDGENDNYDEDEEHFSYMGKLHSLTTIKPQLQSHIPQSSSSASASASTMKHSVATTTPESVHSYYSGGDAPRKSAEGRHTPLLTTLSPYHHHHMYTNFLSSSSSAPPAVSANEMMATTLLPYDLLTPPTTTLTTPTTTITTTTTTTTSTDIQDRDEVVPIESIVTGKKDDYYDNTYEPESNQDNSSSKASSSTTPQTSDDTTTSASSTNQPSSTTSLPSSSTTSSSSTTPEVLATTSPMPDYIEPKVENTPPLIKTRLQRLAVTSGKSFKFTVPEDTFSDAEDMTNLRLDLTDKEGRELKANSWLQFNADTKEIYGLPLDDTVSRWEYRLTATDSGNESVTETLDISVQQHRGVRTVNHEINIAVKINEKNIHYIDWQMNLINGIATTLGDENTNSIVVREVRQNPQDPSMATLVYLNETLPTSECPEMELNNLVRRLDANRLSDLVQPMLGIKSITGQLIGACQKTSVKTKAPTISVKNSPPVPRNQVDRVIATGGHLLVYKVPHDTFFDEGKLTLSLKTKDHKEIGPRHWLQFDSKNEEFYGIPKSGDTGSEEYMLEAADSAGLTATDALVVQVNPAPKRDFSVYYKAYLAIKHENFNADLQRKFVERIAQLFGEPTTQNIQIRAVNTIHDSDSTSISFFNTTLYKSHNRCPEEEMDAVSNVYLQNNMMRERVKRILGPELNITNIQVHSFSCNAQTDVIHRDFVPNKTEEPLLKSTFSEDYMYTIILPAIIIVTMIIIASIIACCLHRRRRKSGKMELGDEEERKSFRTKGIPVIFQDELDEKPEIGNKSPIILKDEKPPLLPPSYNTSNMNGDNDVDEYVPPPAVVVGGREARGKSPATPSYRKPPPYVSP